MVGWLKALLFVAGATVAATGTAYFTGLLDPLLGRGQAVVAALPQQQQQEQPAQPVTEEAAQPAQADGEVEEKQDRLVVPSFDLLRVEPDGSVLIAGKAAADSKIEVLLGDRILGSTNSGAGGDFVVVFDDPLAPGDYQLSLRSISGDVVASSVEAAIVSIPENAGGEVLAMVEAPGQAAELITVPQAAQQPAASASNENVPADSAAETTGEQGAQPATAPTQEEQPAQQEQAARTDDAEPETSAAGDQTVSEQPETSAGGEAAANAAPDSDEQPAASSEAANEEPEQQPAAQSHTVSVDAVEIEGDTIFVAGQAAPGAAVRVYADELLLGDARASDGGRFLIETKRELPVGSYVIRADVLGQDGAVLARAAVPFEREPGESIAAVAPQAPAQQPDAPEAPDAVGRESSAPAQEQASADAAVGENVTAPALQRADGSVIIRRGDSLWRISRRVYGQGVRYSTIYLANQDQITDPNRIWPGQIFTVPHETSEGDQADMTAIGDQAVQPEGSSAAPQ